MLFFSRLTVGLEDSSTFPNLFAALIESEVEWTDEELGLIAQGNILRAMREMEAVRDAMQDREAEQDVIPQEDYWDGEQDCRTVWGG